MPTSEWLHLLREGTPDYAAQPYQQLAAAHRAAGHDSQARRILMAHAATKSIAMRSPAESNGPGLGSSG